MKSNLSDKKNLVNLNQYNTKILDYIKKGLLPQKWMGKKIASIPSWGGCDVDYEWQLPMVEFWLKKNGYKKS